MHIETVSVDKVRIGDMVKNTIGYFQVINTHDCSDGINCLHHHQRQGGCRVLVLAEFGPMHCSTDGYVNVCIDDEILAAGVATVYESEEISLTDVPLGPIQTLPAARPLGLSEDIARLTRAMRGVTLGTEDLAMIGYLGKVLDAPTKIMILSWLERVRLAADTAECVDVCDTCSGECRIYEESQPGGHRGGWVPCPDCESVRGATSIPETNMSDDDKLTGYQRIAATLRELADRLDTLTGLNLPTCTYVQLSIQPGEHGPDRTDERTIAAVDAVSEALFGYGGANHEMCNDAWHYDAHGQIGSVTVAVYGSIDNPIQKQLQTELERLRAELAAKDVLS